VRIFTHFQERLEKTGNVFGEEFSVQVNGLRLVSRILNTTIYLLCKEIWSPDGPWWNPFCVISTRLMLRWCDLWCDNWVTFVVQAESMESAKTISVGIFSGFSKTGTHLKNDTFLKWCGEFSSLWHQTIFSNTMSLSCSLYYNSRITKVHFPLLVPAKISVKGCCRLKIILWNKV
jgi:hypothetical protein